MGGGQISGVTSGLDWSDVAVRESLRSGCSERVVAVRLQRESCCSEVAVRQSLESEGLRGITSGSDRQNRRGGKKKKLFCTSTGRWGGPCGVSSACMWGLDY